MLAWLLGRACISCRDSGGGPNAVPFEVRARWCAASAGVKNHQMGPSSEVASVPLMPA